MQTPLPGTVVPPPFVRRWTPRRVILATLAVVSVVVGFFLMYRFSNALFVLFVGAVLATAMRPAVDWLEKRHVPQWGGVLLIYLALVLVLVGIAATLIPLLVDQGSQIADEVPDYYVGARDWLRESDSQILRRVGNNLPAGLDLSAVSGPTQQQAEATGDESPIVDVAGSTVGLILCAESPIDDTWDATHRAGAEVAGGLFLGQVHPGQP